MSSANTVVRTVTSMPSHSGGWLGMEAMAAKAKMWNREPAGRSLQPGNGHRTGPGNQGGGQDQEPGCGGAVQAPGGFHPCGERSQEDHQQHQQPGPQLEHKPDRMRLAAAVDSREGAEGREDCQVQPAQEHQGNQRDEDADGAPQRRMVVLVSGANAEHLGKQLHVGSAFLGVDSDGRPH